MVKTELMVLKEGERDFDPHFCDFEGNKGDREVSYH